MSINSEEARAKQIILEFFAKSLHVILESRTPFVTSSPSSSSKPRDKWFNLALTQSPTDFECFDIGCLMSLDPLVVNVVLDELGSETKNEKIIERWLVQYDKRTIKETVTTSRRSSSNDKLKVMYKKATLLLRSLFVMVRLLPAYKIFRELKTSGRSRKYNLVPKVPSIAEPLSRREEAEMKKFDFTPVDTISGRLCLSVSYSSLSDVSFGHSTLMSPIFITDYVGSPLTVPYKRFSSPSPYGSPPLPPLQRCHGYKASPSSVSFPEKSQEAEVGVFVKMLKKAPPLRQDVSELSNNEARADEVALSKTTAEALAELKCYKEMKKMLFNPPTLDHS